MPWISPVEEVYQLPMRVGRALVEWAPSNQVVLLRSASQLFFRRFHGKWRI